MEVHSGGAPAMLIPRGFDDSLEIGSVCFQGRALQLECLESGLLGRNIRTGIGELKTQLPNLLERPKLCVDLSL